jgi:hypothetical protein
MPARRADKIEKRVAMSEDKREQVGEAKQAEKDDIYTNFDALLKKILQQYYERSGKLKKGNFIALLIASGEMTSLAVDSIKDGSGVKRLALGAAGVVALRIGLRYALSGPLGIILAGATAASLVGYFVRNRREITQKIGRYRQLVAELRESYDKLQSDHRDGRLSRDQLTLMVDGLMQRFLGDLD